MRSNTMSLRLLPWVYTLIGCLLLLIFVTSVLAKPTEAHHLEGIDHEEPYPTLRITGGVTYSNMSYFTQNPTVDFSISTEDPYWSSGLDSMRFSDDNGQTWSSWEPYATTKRWTTQGPDGTRQVFVQVRDNQGNIGQGWTQLTLDRAAPTISGMSPKHRSVIKDTTPTIKATIKDYSSTINKSNLALYINGKKITKFSWYGSRLVKPSPTLVYNSPRLTKGKKTVKVVARDTAGNVSAKSWSFTIR